MKKELDEKLCAKYPAIFRDRHGKVTETCPEAAAWLEHASPNLSFIGIFPS